MGAPPGGMMPGMPGMMPGMAPQGMPGMPPVSGTPDQMGYQFYGQQMPGQQMPPPGAVAYTTAGDNFNMQGMAGALPPTSSDAGGNNQQPGAAIQSGQVLLF